MFESLNSRIVQLHNNQSYVSARALRDQYNHLVGLLSKHLDGNQLEFIPTVSQDFVTSDLAKIRLIQELITTSDMIISFLGSMDMDLNRELYTKKEDLRKKENEINLREKEVESYKNLLKKSLEAIKHYPELQRSRTVEEIKKSHRRIEKNSKPK